MAQSIILGAVTGVGGGMVGDLSGSPSAVFPVAGAGVCIAIRLIGVRCGIGLPLAPSERDQRAPPS